VTSHGRPHLGFDHRFSHNKKFKKHLKNKRDLSNQSEERQLIGHCTTERTNIGTKNSITMSMRLVRKFLQEDDRAADASRAADTDKNNNRSKKRKRRRRDHETDALAAATQEDVLQATIHNMMYLDRAMATHKGKTDSKNGATKRIHEASKTAKKRRKQLLENESAALLGNSRSSSSKMRLPSVPTFSKKRHKKEQEEKRLKQIAKLLKTQQQKKKKSSLDFE
jgi:hypothetical protein